MANEQKYQIIKVRIDSATKKQLKLVAAKQKTNVSTIVRDSISDYLQKDISWQGQMQASMEVLRSQIERLNQIINLFIDFWLFWTVRDLNSRSITYREKQVLYTQKACYFAMKRASQLGVEKPFSLQCGIRNSECVIELVRN